MGCGLLLEHSAQQRAGPEDVDSGFAGSVADGGEMADGGELADGGMPLGDAAGGSGDAGATLVDASSDAALPSFDPRIHYRSVGVRAGSVEAESLATILEGERVMSVTLPPDSGRGDRIEVAGESFHIFAVIDAGRALVEETSPRDLIDQSATLHRAFNDLPSWESARQGDLVAEDRVEIAVLYDDGPFMMSVDDVLVIEGSTTDATHYMEIRAAAGHEHGGIPGAGVVIDGQGGTGSGAPVCIRVIDRNVRMRGLELRRCYDQEQGGSASVGIAGQAVIDRFLIHSFDVGNGIRTFIGAEAPEYTIRNSIVFDGTRGIVGEQNRDSVVTVQNCTVMRIVNWGVLQRSGRMTVENTISMQSGTQDFLFEGREGSLTFRASMSSDGSADCATCMAGMLPGDQFECPDSTCSKQDFHLVEGSDAIDVGDDLSASGFAHDVDGQPRGSDWDIGADER